MGTVERADTGFPHGHPTSCQPGCIRMLAYLTKTFGTGNDGCYNPNSILQPSGLPSWHVYGKAIDPAMNWNTAGGARVGNAVFDWAVANRESLNLQQAIGGNRIWDIQYGERRYSHDDHFNHVHIAVGYASSQNWQPGTIITPPMPGPVPKEGELPVRIMIDAHGGPNGRIAIGDGITARLVGSLAEVQRLQNYIPTLLTDPKAKPLPVETAEFNAMLAR